MVSRRKLSKRTTLTSPTALQSSRRGWKWPSGCQEALSPALITARSPCSLNSSTSPLSR